MKDKQLLIVATYCLFAGTVLGFAAAQMLRMPTLCSAVDTDCIRSWLAATSGWAAVIAAAATIFVINRQIRASNRQHVEQMKFQAYETLILAQQVGQAATSAFGTITQIFHEFDHVVRPRSKERLDIEVRGAKFALEIIQSAQMPEKRRQIQGNLPPARVTADVALANFIKIGEAALKLTDQQFEEELGRNHIRAASGELVMAHGDLKHLSDQMREFQKRWRHLSI